MKHFCSRNPAFVAVGRKPSGSYNYRDIPDGLRRSASKMLHSVSERDAFELKAPYRSVVTVMSAASAEACPKADGCSEST